MHGTRSPAHRPSARLPASTGLSPAARTATRTWPGPATGSATRTGLSCSGPPNSLTSTALIWVPSVGAAHHGHEAWLILRVGHAAVGTHQAAHRDAVGVEFGLAVAADLGPGQPGPAGAGCFDGFRDRGNVRGALPLSRERFLIQCRLVSLQRRGHQVPRAVDQDSGLHRGQAGRHAESEVVTVSNDDAADKAGRDAP